MKLLPNSFRHEIFTIFARKLRKFVRNTRIPNYRQAGCVKFSAIWRKNLKIVAENGAWKQSLIKLQQNFFTHYLAHSQPKYIYSFHKKSGI